MYIVRFHCVQAATSPDKEDAAQENASDDETMKQKTLYATRNNYAPGGGNEDFDLEKHLDPEAEVCIILKLHTT